MKNIQHYKAEWILFFMVMTQGIPLFFPNSIPIDLRNLILLALLIGFILCKLEHIDHAIQRKFN